MTRSVQPLMSETTTRRCDHRRRTGPSSFASSVSMGLAMVAVALTASAASPTSSSGIQFASASSGGTIGGSDSNLMDNKEECTGSLRNNNNDDNKNNEKNSIEKVFGSNNNDGGGGLAGGFNPFSIPGTAKERQGLKAYVMDKFQKQKDDNSATRGLINDINAHFKGGRYGYRRLVPDTSRLYHHSTTPTTSGDGEEDSADAKGRGMKGASSSSSTTHRRFLLPQSLYSQHEALLKAHGLGGGGGLGGVNSDGSGVPATGIASHYGANSDNDDADKKIKIVGNVKKNGNVGVGKTPTPAVVAQWEKRREEETNGYYDKAKDAEEEAARARRGVPKARLFKGMASVEEDISNSLEDYDVTQMVIDTRNNPMYNDDNKASVAGYTGKAEPLPTTTGECTQCDDPAFVLSSAAAEEACRLPLISLESSAMFATSDFETDLAWSNFCSSDCYIKMMKIPKTHYCCLGRDIAPSFLNMMTACKASTQIKHTTRYCGAEMSNLLAVGCNHSTASACAADKFCEWTTSAEESVCLFKPSKANLDYICTDCNRQYFEQFPGGGIFNYSVHAMLGGVYGGFCNKIQDEYCFLTAADMGYRMAQTATQNDFVSMCKNDEATLRSRLCHRVTATRAAEAIRRRSLEVWKTCNISTEADSQCDYECAGGFLVAIAMEKASMLACSNDPSNHRGGYICPKIVNQMLSTGDKCIRETYDSFFCTSYCDYKARAAAVRMGCCGPVVGQGGFEIAYQAPYPTRYILGATPLGLSYINDQGYVATRGVTRPARTNLEFTMIEQRVDRLVNSNAMMGFANCSAFLLEFPFWTENTTKCEQVPTGRTYYIHLNVNYASLNECVNRDYVYAALKADVCAVLGITRAQLVQTYLGEDATYQIMMEGSRRVYNTLLMVLTTKADSPEIVREIDLNLYRAQREGRFVFPTAGVEALVNCPNVLPNSHTQILNDIYPVKILGEAPVTANGAPLPPLQQPQSVAAVMMAVVFAVVISSLFYPF